jgi:hypothetical protein
MQVLLTNKYTVQAMKKGQTMSQEQRDAISAGMKGKPKTAEHRANISASLRVRSIRAAMQRAKELEDPAQAGT